MQKAWKAVAVLTIVGAGLSAEAKPVAAQGTGVIPIRVKVGVTLAQDSAAKRFAGSTRFNGEVDVNLPNLGLGNTVFTAGYSQGSRDGRKLRVIPLTLARTFGLPNPAARVTGNVYFGVGAGAYLLRASGDGVSESKTRLGGFGMVGYQFPNPYFIEAKYHVVSGKVGGVRPNGLALMVGRHF